MRIREVGCEESIVLSKFKFNCDEVDKSIPDPLPQNLNHFMLIVGKPGSSKTTLLLNLICKRGLPKMTKSEKIFLPQYLMLLDSLRRRKILLDPRYIFPTTR